MSHAAKNCLSVLLGDRCNLACRYCYARGNSVKADEPMDEAFIRRGIKDYLAEFDVPYLRFFSDGEPTLFLENIRRVLAIAKEEASGWQVELQTNGYFSEATASTLVEEGVTIFWVSCDGPPDVQDYYRPARGGASSDVVERSIRWLAGRAPVLGVRSTVGQTNLHRQKEMIDYFHELGVRYVCSDLMFANTACGKYFEKPVSPLEYAEEFWTARLYAAEKGIWYGSIFIVNFDGATPFFCRSSVPLAHLTVDGYVSCCDMVSHGRVDSPLLYGRFDPASGTILYDQEKIATIRSRRVENLPECADCPAALYCGGGCMGEALNERGSIFAIKREVCDAVRYLAERMKPPCPAFPVFHP
jgi:uncharacterized protein